MLVEIKKMFDELGCVCMHATDDRLEFLSRECARFDVVKTDDGYVVCGNEVQQEPFYIWHRFRGCPSMDDVKEVVDSIRKYKIFYRSLGIESFRNLKNLKIVSVNEELNK